MFSNVGVDLKIYLEGKPPTFDDRGLLHTAGRAQQELPLGLLEALAGALTSDDVRASEHPAIK